ncbi:hypothetical protein EP51_14270 [Rhodococcus opacus]|uniref:Uncharacterized protein n=1 Tax=Rhodococcus opacus TaxID=37919 RepID=A0A076EJ50_RHOOP|nr:hypothetical protein EP51_14270 [Rhodococcus opacus]
MIMSLVRPVIATYPSESITQMSPVYIHRPASIASAVLSRGVPSPSITVYPRGAQFAWHPAELSIRLRDGRS